MQKGNNKADLVVENAAENAALKKENRELKTEIHLLKEQLAQLKRMVFGASRERYVPIENPNQGVLFEEKEASTLIEEAVEEAVEEAAKEVVVKKRPARKKKPPVRNKFPESIHRTETVIIPQEVQAAAEDYVKIGEDVTEILAYTPAELHVKKIIRPRYARKMDNSSKKSEKIDNSKEITDNSSEISDNFLDNSSDLPAIAQEPIPPRLVPKGMVDESLIAQIIIEKIQFHIPVHRFEKKLKQLGITFIKQKNLNNWLHRGAEALLPLYHLLQADVLGTGYVQADETRIQVLSKLKKNASHRGQMWVYFAPTIKATFFNYEPTRSTQAADVIFENYQGTIQSDGYSVYLSIGKRAGIKLIHCMAHVRRKFYEAKESEPILADFALKEIQQLYKIEEEARKSNLKQEQRLELRQTKALPILEKLKKWLLEKSADRTILPKSKIRTAIDYALSLWKGLEAYAQDGMLEIDNNLVENTIRPVALGRKNYLFAGSHDAAQNLAILYSIIGTCEKNGINTFKYLNWILPKIANEKITPDAVNWLPHRVNPDLFKIE